MSCCRSRGLVFLSSSYPFFVPGQLALFGHRRGTKVLFSGRYRVHVHPGGELLVGFIHAQEWHHEAFLANLQHGGATSGRVSSAWGVGSEACGSETPLVECRQANSELRSEFESVCYRQLKNMGCVSQS